MSTPESFVPANPNTEKANELFVQIGQRGPLNYNDTERGMVTGRLLEIIKDPELSLLTRSTAINNISSLHPNEKEITEMARSFPLSFSRDSASASLDDRYDSPEKIMAALEKFLEDKTLLQHEEGSTCLIL